MLSYVACPSLRQHSSLPSCSDLRRTCACQQQLPSAIDVQHLGWPDCISSGPALATWRLAAVPGRRPQRVGGQAPKARKRRRRQLHAQQDAQHAVRGRRPVGHPRQVVLHPCKPRASASSAVGPVPAAAGVSTAGCPAGSTRTSAHRSGMRVGWYDTTEHPMAAQVGASNVKLVLPTPAAT